MYSKLSAINGAILSTQSCDLKLTEDLGINLKNNDKPIFKFVENSNTEDGIFIHTVNPEGCWLPVANFSSTKGPVETLIDDFEFAGNQFICDLDPDMQILHDNVSTIIDCFDNLGIEFPDGHFILGCPLKFGPSTRILDDETDDALIFFFPYDEDDSFDGDETMYYSTSIIAHEYGHNYLNDFLDFPSSTSETHRIIHEGFSDLFALYTNSIGCGNPIDWIGEEPARDFRTIRTEDLCWYSRNLSDFQDHSPHDYIEPFNFLAYSLVGVEEMMDLESFYELTVDIISTFPDDGNLHDFAHRYVEYFLNEFGECSEEAGFIIDFFESMCLGASGYNDCSIRFNATTSFWNGSTTNNTIPVCENVSNGRVTISIDENDIGYDVNVQWLGLRPEWTINNQTNNTNVSGNQLSITFPKYNFYPRTYTICARYPINSSKGCVEIFLEDCDNNDPECEDLFEMEENLTKNIHERSLQDIINSNGRMELYDIQGRLVFSGYTSGLKEFSNNYPSQVLILIEYDRNGSYLGTYKIITSVGQ